MLRFVEEANELQARIRVIGVGGGGGNAVNNMITGGVAEVEFIAANTDAQALKNSLAANRLQLGVEVTRGLGAGADPAKGEAAAMASESEIREAVSGADMVFVTAGMGGGTGTGGAPVVARLARESGALTVGVVTKPFSFEGKRRMRNAEEGIIALRNEVDTLIIIPNERLFTVAQKGTSALDGFRRVDDVLLCAIKGISDLIYRPGVINLDFADVRRIMAGKGRALMGTGKASGSDRAVEAAQLAISSPLLEDNSVAGSRSIIINITGSSATGIHEIQRASQVVQEAAHEDAEIIFGMALDEDMGEELMVTVIATEFADSGYGMMGSSTAVREGTLPSFAERPQDREVPTFIRRQHEPSPGPQLTLTPPTPSFSMPAHPSTVAQGGAPSAQQQKAVAAGGAKRPAFTLIEEDEEFEIPAYLRRQAD